MKRLLAFVIVVALLGSCAKNGEYENYHPNGKVSDWILYENDHIIHSISYDTSGNFSSEMKFVDEFPYFQKSYIDGILTFFHESTQDSDHLVKREAYFNRNGQKEYFNETTDQYETTTCNECGPILVVADAYNPSKFHIVKSFN